MDILNHIKTDYIEEHKKALINIIFTSNFITDEISKVLKPFDISLQQFNVLRILKGQKGKPANLSTIQERMISKMSNTTRIVDKLIDKKLVERNICKENRRKVEIQITPYGKSQLNLINKVVEAKEKELTKALDQEELKTINHYLNKIRK